METIPKQVRIRLEAMSLTDLDVMAKICGKATGNIEITEKMKIRVEWISHVMTIKIIDTFDTNDESQ